MWKYKIVKKVIIEGQFYLGVEYSTGKKDEKIIRETYVSKTPSQEWVKSTIVQRLEQLELCYKFESQLERFEKVDNLVDLVKDDAKESPIIDDEPPIVKGK